MDDYVSREAVETFLRSRNYCLDTDADIEYVVECLRKEIPAADVRPVVRGAPLIEINEPWQPMRGDKDRFYYTKRYLCRNCEYQIKTESWEKDRCFGAGTIFKENSMPNFCPNCGAYLLA